MSCCVKSSFLRSLAEQKGQKSMLIKGCGQLLARGFALIKAKCSCSRKTLQIYSSNSAHWLWGEPVGSGAFRALTKKSQHFLQSYEVWVCVCVRAGCARGHFQALGFFLFFHILQRTRSTCKTWCVTTADLGPVPGSSLPFKNLTKNTADEPRPYHLFLLIKGGKILSLGSEALRLLWQQTHLVGFWGWRRAPRSESSECPFAKAPPLWWETAHTSPNCWWAYF